MTFNDLHSVFLILSVIRSMNAKQTLKYSLENIYRIYIAVPHNLSEKAQTWTCRHRKMTRAYVINIPAPTSITTAPILPN